MTEVLQVAVNNDLTEIKSEAEEVLKGWFLDDGIVNHIQEFQLDSITSLVSLCLPLHKAKVKDAFTSKSCPILWNSINHRISTQLSTLNSDKVDENKSVMFSNLVFHMMQTLRPNESA